MIDLATMPFEKAIQTAMELFGYDRAQAREMVALSQGRIKGDTTQGKKKQLWGLPTKTKGGIATSKGGAGSGNWRHTGRPGIRGGSGPGGGSLASAMPAPAGTPAPAPVRPRRTPKPTPAPAAPQGPKPVTPVSTHLDVHATDKKLKFEMRKTIEYIDQVHGDGPLTQIPIFEKALSGGTMGDFMSLGTQAKHIRVKTNIHDETRLAISHEIGHFIDHQGGSQYNAYPFALSAGVMAKKGRTLFPKATQAAMGKLEQAIKGSATYQKLEQMQSTGTIPIKGGGTIVVDKQFLGYLLDKKEVWARAYSQYIANKSGSHSFTHELHQQQRHQASSIDYPRYWDDAEFAPIQDGFDDLFKSLGWS